MKKISALIFAALSLTSLAAASTASAATEVGSNCEATSTIPYTVLPLAYAPGNPPLAAPSSGVVTQWKSKLPAIPPGLLSQAMRVFRATGVPNQFQVVAETATAPMVTGVNVVPARVPVNAGDRFGLFGAPASFYCNTGKPEDVMGFFEGNAAVGSTQTYKPAPSIQVPVSVVIEPDADADGYGDETQDKCPQSASFQTACPTVSLETFSIVGRKSVTALVTTTSRAPVTVTGTVRLPKAGKKGKAKTLLLSAPAQTVDPGRIGRFEIVFPKSLQNALKALSRKSLLTLTVVVTGTDLVNRSTTSSFQVALKGQAKTKGKKG
jgi:hypothetical protein